MTYIPNNPEPTFYSQRAKDNWLKSKADYEKSQQVAAQRRLKQAEIDANSREATNRQLLQERQRELASAQPTISWTEYYKL